MIIYRPSSDKTDISSPLMCDNLYLYHIVLCDLHCTVDIGNVRDQSLFMTGVGLVQIERTGTHSTSKVYLGQFEVVTENTPIGVGDKIKIAVS